MKRRTPVQDAIRKVLRESNTGEPYPVHVSWEKIARHVYGCRYVSTDDVRKVQRVAERMPDVGFSHFKGGRRRAGAFLEPDLEQAWFKSRLRRDCSKAAYLSDSPHYRSPTREEIISSFVAGCHEEFVPADLAKLTALVNKHCGTSFDPSEVAWWRLGLVARRREERKAHLTGIHRALGQLMVKKEREEREARMVRVDPFSFDPETTHDCPLCHQELPVGTFPVQRSTRGAPLEEQAVVALVL